MPIGASGVPYSPSWVDRLTDRIDDLPGPAWLFYALTILALALAGHIAFWLDGTLPVGVFDPVPTTFAFYTVYWLGMYHYLTRVCGRSLREFRPLLEDDEPEVERIRYRLSVLPRRIGWICVPLGILLGLLSSFESQGSGEELVFQTAPGIALDVLLTSFLAASMFALIIRSIRQLRLVSILHERAQNIDLLDLEPPHAFSNLTARTGVAVLVLLVLGSLQGGLATALDVILTGGFSLVAIGIFVIPLIGMRNRLKDEKENRLREMNELLRKATHRLHGGIRDDDYRGMKETEAALAALMRERRLVERVPTWPWDPGTLRGFASTLVLPIVIWLVTRILERFV